MGGPQTPGEILEAMFSYLDGAPVGANVLPAEWHRISGAIAALGAAGQLSEADQAGWNKRLKAAADHLVTSEQAQAFRQMLERSQHPAAPEEMRPAAQRVLRQTLDLVEQGREAMRASPDESPDVQVPRDQLMLQRAHGALEALHGLGLVDDAERQGWGERFQAAAQLEPPGPSRRVAPQRLTTTSRASATVYAQTPAPASPASQRLLPRPPRFSGTDLRRCIQVEAPPTDGFRVLLVEVYTDGVVVEWTQTWQPRQGARAPHPRLSLTDNLKTSYQRQGSGGGTFGTGLMRHHTIFVPAIPDDARWIEISLESNIWRLDIPRMTVRTSGR